MLKDKVHITHRFLRSIRIDTDLGDPKALEGFICSQTSASVLLAMAKHIEETEQGAFTWTGAYGGGKSSLVVALGALLSSDVDLQKYAAKIFGKRVTGTLLRVLPTGTKGWQVIPVIGRRENPAVVIGEALSATNLVSQKPRNGWGEGDVISAVKDAVAHRSENHGGLIIFMDEMGKFLEGAAHGGADIYIFQQLAELASRSHGRFLFIGILHQAFEEYGGRLSREIQDEWSKIQGRFVDLSINASGEEQIELISSAIRSDWKSKKSEQLAQLVASMVTAGQPATYQQLTRMLERCWPLHPVVACLLGSISRRRFGQNQRSIFGFLNSSEPHGFQDFIKQAPENHLYGPDKLWDYLRANLEPSILASPDGHRWALAAEALERCEAMGGEGLHLKLLKTIAVVDLFKERSRLASSFNLLKACFHDESDRDLQEALDQLRKWSLTIFKKFLDAYTIYAGSDFDIDRTVRTTLEGIDELDFLTLTSLAGLQPVLAKRHYHDTGSMRWFDINVCALQDVLGLAEDYDGDDGAIGQFLLAVPTNGEKEEFAKKVCQKAARNNDEWDIVVGISKRSWAVVPLARELLALDIVQNNSPELAGDEIARREVEARIAETTGHLELELKTAFDGTLWYSKDYAPKAYQHADLNNLASTLADRRFEKSPRLHNELLNRQKPSASAVSAQNALLRHMVLNEGEPRLGIKNFPAEGGLFASILEATGVYKDNGDGAWNFVAPSDDDINTSRLAPLWSAADSLIESQNSRTISISDLYDEWRRPPIGLKDGLMPIFAVTYILSRRNHVAVYRDNVFRSRFNDVDMDYLAKDPTVIQIRWMNLSDIASKLLLAMADIARDLGGAHSIIDREAINVARGLISIYEQLPSWTKRTMQLSKNALHVRDLFKNARDPNKFLFDDIASTVGGGGLDSEDNLHSIVTELRQGLGELSQAYVSMLHKLRDTMLAELHVISTTPEALVSLRERAENIRQLTGDFQLDAFVGRLSQFNGSDKSFEGIASLAVSKPPRDWVDPDLDRASVELADLSQRFLKAETFARVKGRSDKRQSIAMVIGMRGDRPIPIHEEFEVSDSDRDMIDDVIMRVSSALALGRTNPKNIILAALAEISAHYITEEPTVSRQKKKSLAS